MKNWRYLLVQVAGSVTISLFSGVGGATLAQQSERPAGPPDLKRDQRDREHREAMLRTSETGATIARLDEKRIEAAVSLIKDDFRQLQIVRNEIARYILAEKPLDFRFISNKAGEVNKRTERLRKYLMPPIPEDASRRRKIEFDDQEMKDVLVQLCRLIDSFVENPILKTPGRVDVEQSTKAGLDLLNLVELSGNIKRSAEQLGKRSS